MPHTNRNITIRSIGNKRPRAGRNLKAEAVRAIIITLLIQLLKLTVFARPRTSPEFTRALQPSWERPEVQERILLPRRMAGY
jgi:hypothetical protein